jgi:pimeloyl-ACP methyl ester carboxylesterase
VLVLVAALALGAGGGAAVGALGTALPVRGLAEGLASAIAHARGASSPGTAGSGALAQEPTPSPERACPDGSDFRCVTLQVPADHFRPGSPTWPVTFALRRGDVDSRGVLVTATGGPGSSGIAVADQYTASMPKDITDHYDLVFLDQRGVGLSHPFRCDDALAGDQAPDVPPDPTPAQRNRLLAQTQTFVADCLGQAGVDDADTGRYATRQAVEDLEAFRRWLGADRLLLYGESYGTEFQQAYAAAHPDHVAGLVLDGVVDTATDPVAFAAESSRAYSDVLATTLAACDAESACAADGPGGGALAAYDRLAAQLRAAPLGYAYPLPDGRSERRELTLHDLEDAAAGSVSALADRAAFQRALNAEAAGDVVPLARLAAADDGTDADTGDQLSDPTFSAAAFYAVDCADHRWLPPGRTAGEQLDAWAATAHRDGVDGERLGSGFYGDLPCLLWPGAGTATPVASLPADPPYPVLFLTADTDPNTPTAGAQRLFARTHGSTALVLLTGGPHVVFGRGVACVDDVVTRLVTTGQLPPSPVTVCTGPVAGPYAPAPPAHAAGWTSPEQAVQVVTTGVLGNPGYLMWDGSEPYDTGCDAGGTAHVSLDRDDAVHVRLTGCALTPGVPVDGTLTVADGGTGDATAVLRLPFGRLVVAADGTVTGTFRGRTLG